MLIAFFLGIILLFSQQIDPSYNLLERARKNHKSLFINSEKAIKEAKDLENIACKAKDREAELLAINTQCVYYMINNNYEKLLVKAKTLFEKAKLYNNHGYQIIAKIWIFDFYHYNQLDDLAFLALEDGKRIINRADGQDSLVIDAKSNLYRAYANYYQMKGDYQNQLKYIYLSMIENPKQNDEFIDYSNLASVYLKINNDSAKHYVKLAIAKDFDSDRKDIRSSNFIVKGLVEFEQKNYDEALFYLHKAEKMADFNSNMDIQTLYNKIVEIYYILQDKENIKKYEAKRDSLRLNVSEHRNNLLRQMLNENKGAIPKLSWHLLASFSSFIFLITILIYIIIRKNRILSLQEKTSQSYLEELQIKEREPNYSKLLQLLEEKDPAFINLFNKYFPDFSKKLIEINSKVIQTEIEFCALLKLKVPTKDIAQYKSITPKTVQNKKYLIRKKLKVPKNIDIYQWFDLL